MKDTNASMIINRLSSTGLVARRNMQGYSNAEIIAIEKRLGYRLPQLYRDFISIAGRRCGCFLTGTQIFFDDPDDLLDLQDSARMLLKENDSVVSLPDSSFVFFMHQGYQFGYFIAAEENTDSEVFHYMEGKNDVTSLYPSLSAYFLAAIDAECVLLGRNWLERRIKSWFYTLYP